MCRQIVPLTVSVSVIWRIRGLPSLQVQPSEVSEANTMHRLGNCVYKGA